MLEVADGRLMYLLWLEDHCTFLNGEGQYLVSVKAILQTTIEVLGVLISFFDPECPRFLVGKGLFGFTKKYQILHSTSFLCTQLGIAWRSSQQILDMEQFVSSTGCLAWQVFILLSVKKLQILLQLLELLVENELRGSIDIYTPRLCDNLLKTSIILPEIEKSERR